MIKKKIKIYIAGHNGMVGRSVVKYFKKKNFGKLILIDRKKLDLENYNKVKKFLFRKKPDVIINCAGKVGGIMANYLYPADFLNENILIQTNLIKCAFLIGVNNFINLGSSCIYPRNSKQPIKEEYILTKSLEKTNEAYAIAKIVGVKLCEYYNKQFKKEYFTLMPCNLYGPNDNFDIDKSHFIPALIKKISQSKINNCKPIEIWGSGKPKREVMHVDDLASAIYFITKLKINNNKKLTNLIRKNALINVGSGTELKISDYVKLIKKILKNNCNIFFNKKYPDGTPRKILNNSKISLLGWAPKISLNKGLNETIKWYQKNSL